MSLGAGGGSSASLKQQLGKPGMVSGTQTLTAKEEESSGPGWGAPVGTPALLRPNKEPVRWLGESECH